MRYELVIVNKEKISARMLFGRAARIKDIIRVAVRSRSDCISVCTVYEDVDIN